jgi:hypothetical protein
VLHLLNGDATAAVMPDAIPGARAVWRDIMMEGPPVADGVARGAWLAPRLGVTAEEYARRWRDGEAALARAREQDELVLWFEQDLFCAVNLWYVLDRLGDHPALISLVFPPLGNGFDGLGRLGHDDFAPLFERRTLVDAAARVSARALWRAYSAPDPTALADADAALPFARRAVRLHAGRFPSTEQGLNEVEQATLHALGATGAREFGDLFRAVSRQPPLSELGMGDVQFAAILGELAAGATPILRIDDPAGPFGRWRVTRTAAAAELLAGRADRLTLCPLDRWLGGVHLLAGAPIWRWDGARVVG